MVRLPSRKARLLGKLAQAIEDHRAIHHRDPSLEELAGGAAMEPEALGALLRWRESVLSLDAPMDEDGAHLMEIVAGNPDDNPLAHAEAGERRERIEQVLGRLSLKERAILRLRFGFETGKSMSLRKTCARIGLSQEGVRRLERVALAKLRRSAQREELACLI
jgi:RNA polymerase primary sigma factor